jgi:hypothetical protein
MARAARGNAKADTRRTPHRHGVLSNERCQGNPMGLAQAIGCQVAQFSMSLDR